MASNYYPPLSDLLDASAIPGDIEFIENNTQAVIEDLLGKVFYKNLFVDSYPSGDGGIYTMTLMTKSIRQSLFDTGLSLVFFQGQDDNYADFNVLFSWRWPIKRYIAAFESASFPYTAESFVNILRQMAPIRDLEEFLGVFIDVFLDDGSNLYADLLDKLMAIVNDLNTGGGENVLIGHVVDRLGLIKRELDTQLSYTNLYTLKDIYDNYRGNPLLSEAADTICAALQGLVKDFNIAVDVYSELTKAIMSLVSSLDEKFEKLVRIFRPWLGEFTLEHIKNMLIPQFAVELDGINMGLEFPRDMLTPMVSSGGNWQQDMDEAHNTTLLFTAGNIRYSTETGFTINTDDEEINLTRCMIPKLGVQLAIKKIKLDLSRSSNIAEATADQRPPEFIGAYINEVDIYLPDEWFKSDDNAQTLEIYGRDIIIGTGGLSGTLGLRSTNTNAVQLQATMKLSDDRTITIVPDTNGQFKEGNAVSLPGNPLEDGRYTLKIGGAIVVKAGKIDRFLPADGELTFKLGKSGGSGYWKIGFSDFYMKFWQNKILESEIKGSLTIPNFKQEGKTEDLRVDIDVFFQENGDFRITASPEGGLTICLGEDGKVFKIVIKSLEAGKDNDKIYVQVSGDIDFSNNPLLNSILSAPVEVKKLRIYSDGSFEIEGGSIPIPGSLHMKLGPVEVGITNITLGAETMDDGNYKFIGFDCGVSTGAGGLDLRGDGIKIYFNHDGSHMFLRIAGLGINLFIPGNASEDSASLILKGYLSLKQHEYMGSVSFKLPKAKIAGGAAMKMKPSVPAFIVDAFIELSTPLPMGPTGLGIFGFRGLFGLRYIADLPDGATEDPEKLFKFYTDKKPNPINGDTPEAGLHIGKMVTPEDGPEEFRSSGTPISIGAGISIGTVADNGHTFSMQAFLLLSLPEMLIISGRGNILSERVSIISKDEPPFFAYVAFTAHFISVGMGADYKIKEDGEILDMHAEAKMAYFFNDSSAWYVHVGTKAEPNKAKVLKKIFALDVYSYLMISMSGIETGAGVKFELHKHYGPVKVDVSAYGDVYAMISFRKLQAGGGIACGGTVGASVFGVGFDLSLSAYLMLTVPKPFIVKGGMQVCLEVDFWLYTWRKCFGIDFKWEFDQQADYTEIKILEKTNENSIPVNGYHIGSNNSYPLNYFNTSMPDPMSTELETVPLDTFIDIQFKKPVDPNPIFAKIGGVTNAPVGNIELSPPKAVELQVAHRFEIVDINIMVWNRNNNTWVGYDPYAALDSGAFLENVDPSLLKMGYWQKKGKEYNTMRILSDTPFSFVDDMAGAYIPEQTGMTAETLFCQGNLIQSHCITWKEERSFKAGKWHAYRDITFRVPGIDAVVVPFTNVFNIPLSLSFSNDTKQEIIFPEDVQQLSLKLFSYANRVTVTYYALKYSLVDQNGQMKNQAHYDEVKKVTLTAADFLAPLIYKNNTNAIRKVLIEPANPDNGKVIEVKNEIILLERSIMEGDKEAGAKLKNAQAVLQRLQSLSCATDGIDFTKLYDELENERKQLEAALAKAKTEKSKYCQSPVRLRLAISAITEEQKHLIGTFGLPDVADRGAIHDHLLQELRQDLDNLRLENRFAYQEGLSALQVKAKKNFAIAKALCAKASADFEAIQAAVMVVNDKLKALKTMIGIKSNDKQSHSSTYIHEVCFLTMEEYLINQTIPSQAAVNGNYDAMNSAISNVIPPIWRPDETYAIAVKTNEIIANGNHLNNYYFAFKTGGPIGHFPLAYLPSSVKQQFSLDANGNPSNQTDKTFDKRIEIPENALKFYLDKERCYPNPDGNILNQKPLYYNDVTLQLFYRDPRAYHFFQNWPDYQGLGKKPCSMAIEIKDPSVNPQPVPAVPPVLTVFPLAIINLAVDANPLTMPSVSVINALRNPKIKSPGFNDPTCWQVGGDPIVPASKNPVVTLQNLKPLRLYNAVIYNDYAKDGHTMLRKQIHSYPFQTSRYPDHESQINSYKLTDNSGNAAKAIYTLRADAQTFTAADIVIVAKGDDITGGIQPELIAKFPDTFQRIMFGYLKQQSIPAVVHTEFNLLKNDKTGDLLAIYIRNPEPFNDPRIPKDIMQTTVSAIVNNNHPPAKPAFPVFSKDNSEIILAMNFVHVTSIKIRFNYLLWNGDVYELNHTVTTDNILS